VRTTLPVTSGVRYLGGIEHEPDGGLRRVLRDVDRPFRLAGQPRAEDPVLKVKARLLLSTAPAAVLLVERQLVGGSPWVAALLLAAADGDHEACVRDLRGHLLAVVEAGY